MAILWRFSVFAAVALISACGAVHNSVVTQPTGDIVRFKQIAVAPVQVTSTEQNEDAASLNEQWRRMANDELLSTLTGKGVSTSGVPQGTVECTIDVTYGNRALRYFVGFGAGSGHMRVTISLKDAGGVERYSVLSEADLSIGVFGGDMSGVARDTIHEAVRDFSSRL